MKNLSKADLLIFDMDGTLFKSDVANVLAIKKVLKDMEITSSFSKKDFTDYIGISAEYFYNKILPEEKKSEWKIVSDNVRREFYPFFLKYGRLYPGVRKTLSILKKRNYKLALASKCSFEYLDAANATFKFDKYFDYIEGTQQYNLDKPSLFKKIMCHFSTDKAIAIGDRKTDIEAARQVGIPSIAVSYGFGNNEICTADRIINKFTELLDVFQ